MTIRVSVVILLGLLGGVACGRTESPDVIWQQLTKGDKGEKVKAMESVLQHPEEYSTVLLAVSAGVALGEKRLEDSGFLFYAAKLRMRFDVECFPPTGTGGNDPTLAMAGVILQTGAVVNPAVMADAKVFAKVVERVKKFHPQASAGYEPGYEHGARKTQADAEKAVAGSRTHYLNGLTDMSTLLNDPDYFAAFRTVQDYNSMQANRPTEAAYDKAMKTLLRIEKEKGLSIVTGLTRP